MTFGYISIIYALVVAINFFLGTSIFLDSPKKTTNRFFFFFIIVGIGWIISLFYYYTSSDSAFILILGKVNFAFSILVAYVMYNFILNFLSLHSSIAR